MNAHAQGPKIGVALSFLRPPQHKDVVRMHDATEQEYGGEVLNRVFGIIIFTVPGVIIGAQLGSLLASRISQHTLERGLGVLFTLVAPLTLGVTAKGDRLLFLDCSLVVSLNISIKK